MSGRPGRGGPAQSRGGGGGGRGGDRGRGDRGRGNRSGGDYGRGGGRGTGSSETSSTEIPIRQGPPARGDRGGRGDFRGRGGDFRGRGGRGDFRGRGDSRGGARGGGRSRVPARIYSAPGGAPNPDAQVEKIENRIGETVLKTKSVVATKFPLRPGFGTQGTKILLYANYFELVTDSQEDLYRYNLEILTGGTARPLSKRKSKQVVQLFIEQHLLESKNSIATDYKSTLVSRTGLSLQEGTHSVQYRAPDENEPPENPQIYQVRFQGTGTLKVSELLNYLTSTNASAIFDSKDEVIQALNIVMGHYPKTEPRIESVGGNKHFLLEPNDQDYLSLGGGLEVLRGFFVSVRAATARILVNVQVKNIACYEAGPLKGLIEAVRLSSYRLEKFLRLVRVQATHIRGSKPRIKTIIGLANRRDGHQLEHPPQVSQNGAGPNDVKFWHESRGPSQGPSGRSGKEKKGKKPPTAGPQQAGEYTSVAEYFKRNYNINADPSTPVVNVGSRENPSYLPAEVCLIVPGQPAKAKLNPTQTQKMIQFAVRSPGENADSIVNTGAQVLGIKPRLNSTLSNFHLTPKADLITVPGRVLSAPRISYKGQNSVSTRDGSWNMIKIQFSQAASLRSWTWLILGKARDFWRDSNAFKQTVEEFRQKMIELGIDAKAPVDGTTVPFVNSHDVSNADSVNLRRVEQAINGLVDKVHPQFILVVLPFKDTDIYNQVKLVCDCTRGVLNGCVLAEKFCKPGNHQYFANEALKVNLKLGGLNQLLSGNQLGIIAEGRTMLVGMDVTHPSPGSADDAPSVAGIVASVDRHIGQFPAEVRTQTGRQEMVADLEAMLRSRLDLWAKHNKGALPENIIVYRDGVSEGQYDLVLQNELPLLKSACKKVYPASATNKGVPRIAIIVVGKRHHTRFYATREDDADERSKNPPNGTVVDRGVTEARNWDFYLQAHKALQGTARPAHYFTVWDEIFHKQTPKAPFAHAADVLEDLTHRLCYLFGRATKAVSICPPAYYADLVCERARCHRSDVFDASPEQSVISGQAGQTAHPARPIHANVRDSMYYI